MRDSRESVIKTLHDVATTIQTEETVGAVCERTVSAASEILDFNLCTVVIREDDWLVPYATSKDAPADGSRQMRIDEGLAGKTYQTGTSYVVSEVVPDDETRPAKETYRSGISVPIGEHGVFQAVDTETGSFDERDVELAELLISHTTTALDRLAREQKLQRQNERLDQFALAVSHDLRNPLSAASGNLQLVAEDCDSPHLAAVEDAHDRMQHLIEDVLTFARMGRESLEYSTLDLAPLVDDCWERLEDAHSTLDNTSEQRVRADLGRLQRLLENVLKNAVDHGGPGVSVTVGSLEDGFYVEDDGPGIPKGDRKTVFDPGVTSSEQGTGFGLGIVKQVVDAHGWQVDLTEGSAGGARFEITGVDVIDE